MSCIFMAMKVRERDLFRLLKRIIDSRIMGSNSARGIMPSLRGVIFPAMRYGLRTLYTEPGSPWENGCLESFNGKLRQKSSTGRSSIPYERPRC